MSKIKKPAKPDIRFVETATRYAKIGTRVTVTSKDHGDVWIVQDDNGQRFSIRAEHLSTQQVEPPVAEPETPAPDPEPKKKTAAQRKAPAAEKPKGPQQDLF